jgi:hypothetical protein
MRTIRILPLLALLAGAPASAAPSVAADQIYGTWQANGRTFTFFRDGTFTENIPASERFDDCPSGCIHVRIPAQSFKGTFVFDRQRGEIAMRFAGHPARSMKVVSVHLAAEPSSFVTAQLLVEQLGGVRDLWSQRVRCLPGDPNVEPLCRRP